MTESTVTKMGVRDVFFCPRCGWESFDGDCDGEPCGQTGCLGTLSEHKKEEYEI